MILHLEHTAPHPPSIGTKTQALLLCADQPCTSWVWGIIAVTPAVILGC